MCSTRPTRFPNILGFTWILGENNSASSKFMSLSRLIASGDSANASKVLKIMLIYPLNPSPNKSSQSPIRNSSEEYKTTIGLGQPTYPLLNHVSEYHKKGLARHWARPFLFVNVAVVCEKLVFCLFRVFGLGFTNNCQRFVEHEQNHHNGSCEQTDRRHSLKNQGG